MKTQNRFLLSLAAFLTISLVSLKVFPAGLTGAVSQDISGTSVGTVGNPTGEMVSPALQNCGKNYVETKLEKFPLEGPSPEQEGGAWWACKLRPGFNYSNYDPNDNACPAVPGEESEQLGTEGFQPINANYYGCSYKHKSQPPIAQCLSGFHAVDVKESKYGENPKVNSYQELGVNGGKGKQYTWTSYTYYYDSSFKCVRNGATFPEGNYEADEDACNPSATNASWLGVWKGIWQGTWPYHQICGWKPESNALALPPPARHLLSTLSSDAPMVARFRSINELP